MSMNSAIYEAQDVCLRPIDFEKDPAVESAWTHDPAFLRAMQQQVAMPLSPAAVKKQYERLEKKIEESHQPFYFTIRSQGEERLLGYVSIYNLEWTNAAGCIQIAIGSPADRRRGCGSQAMRLALQYAFHEVNLHRLTAIIGGDNPHAVRFFEKFGFQVEARRREALQRDGQFYDLLMLGLLSAAWRPS